MLAPPCSAPLPQSISDVPHGPVTVSWTDRRGQMHRYAANRHVRHRIPWDAEMATSHLDISLFDSSADTFDVATPLSDALLICDRDRELTDVAACSVTFECDHRAYVAPLFARSWVSNYYVISLVSSPIPSFVSDACADVGWRTAIVALPSATELLNMRRLSCDRHAWVPHGCEAMLQRLLDTASRGPVLLGDLCQRIDARHPARVEPLVNYSLWHGLLSADWTKPITLRTPVMRAGAPDALYERVQPEPIP